MKLVLKMQEIPLLIEYIK